MMNAYAEMYLPGARNALGCMLEVAVSGLGYRLPDFYQLFLTSPYALRFEQGDPSVVAGMSGSELALAVSQRASAEVFLAPRLIDPTPAFWTGWSLAYYQWASGSTFSQIERVAPIQEVCRLYSPFHEMDVSALCQELDRRAAAAQPATNLQCLRLAAQLSQADLAMLSGVPVRSIQQYEQRKKSLNRAAAETVFCLAKALCCQPFELLEHSASSCYDYEVVPL